MSLLFLQEFELRKQARSEGRRYCNTSALTYQAERMPEQIRLNVSPRFFNRGMGVGFRGMGNPLSSYFVHYRYTTVPIMLIQHFTSSLG